MTQKNIETAVEVKNITKSYPGVTANDSVDFKVLKGEIHALVGENGAGKSTLVKILYGIEQPDSGEIFINDKPVEINKVDKAIELDPEIEELIDKIDDDFSNIKELKLYRKLLQQIQRRHLKPSFYFSRFFFLRLFLITNQ